MQLGLKNFFPSTAHDLLKKSICLNFLAEGVTVNSTLDPERFQKLYFVLQCSFQIVVLSLFPIISTETHDYVTLLKHLYCLVIYTFCAFIIFYTCLNFLRHNDVIVHNPICCRYIVFRIKHNEIH